MSSAKSNPLRKIPSVEILAQDLESQNAVPGISRKVLVQLIREAVNEVRAYLEKGGKLPSGEEAVRKEIHRRVFPRAQGVTRPHYGRAINASGIILHTGLGRAVLPSAALVQFGSELGGYSRLQQDVESGKRSRRDEGIERLLQQLTGAEAATVVNNNAAATMIVLNTLAKGREVIVSRGQLIEIGGEFRLPEVMAASGVRLVEVGATNRTHARDYERAINENTAAIMRVHPSNFRIAGFTSEVPSEELVKIAHQRNILMIDDLGAGALMDFSKYGFQKEPTLAESIRAGADVALSSADKLIGGPQGGIILGREKWIAAIRKNPLARVLRVGKLTLTALEATLKIFLDEEKARKEVPTLQMLSRTPAQLANQAEHMVKSLHAKVKGAAITTVPGTSQMGGGSLPEQSLSTTLVSIHPKKISVEQLAAGLRAWTPPIFARIHQDQLLIDPRTLLKDDAEIIVKALTAVLD
jgi:L-seryl-tRNA(Ser) seleniumtransferase